MNREEREKVESEARIHGVGFYDAGHVWFDVWEKCRPWESHSYELAERPYGPEMVRFFVEGCGRREMLLADFLIHGLPADGHDDGHAVAHRALYDCIRGYSVTMYSDYPPSMQDRDIIDRALAALDWYERHLER